MTLRDDLKARMGRFLSVPPERLQDETLLSNLVTDSMLLVNMIIELQEDLGIRIVQDDLRNVKTIGDLVGVLEKKMH